MALLTNDEIHVLQGKRDSSDMIRSKIATAQLDIPIELTRHITAKYPKLAKRADVWEALSTYTLWKTEQASVGYRT